MHAYASILLISAGKSVFLYLPGELICVKVHEHDVTKKLDPKAAN